MSGAPNQPPFGAPSRDETTSSEARRPPYRPHSSERPTSRTEAQDTIHRAVELIKAKYDVALTTAYTTLVQASADLNLTVRETAARIVDESLETADPGTGCTRVPSTTEPVSGPGRASRSSDEENIAAGAESVGLRGLEPLTSSLSGKRSNRLSYRPGMVRLGNPR